MQGSNNTTRRAALAALAAPLIAISLLAGLADPPAATGQQGSCPGLPSHLSPKGGAGARLTLMLRINKPKNVDYYANFQAARGQLRTRDIFLVNTRFRGSSPEEAEQIIERLKEAFPCNRIVALNGLGADPQQPGYAFALADSPHLWAVLLDWERRDWGNARATNPGMSRWKRKLGRNLKRLRARLGDLVQNLQASGGARRVGAVPTFFHDWHYGRLARVLDYRNKRFGHRRGGLQAVATQGSCKKRRGGLKGMRPTAKRLFRQYGKKNRKRRNLAFQISFSDRAKAKRHLPIRSVNEGRAARCIRSALRAGGGAFLLWSSPESVWALSETAKFRKLRHRGG